MSQQFAFTEGAAGVGDIPYRFPLDLTVEDPDTFYQPWKTYQEYARVARPLEAEICPENNENLFDYGTPKDLTPDF